MDTFGKGLFWLGFIVLIGVVFAYLIMIIAGAVAVATTSVMLTICAAILVGALLMLLGRSYERHAERKRRAEAAETLDTTK